MFDWAFLLLLVFGIAWIFAVEVFAVGWAISFTVIVPGFILWAYPEILASVKANPGLAVTYLLGYIAAGVAWSFVKWIGYARHQIKEYYKYKEKAELNPNDQSYARDLESFLWNAGTRRFSGKEILADPKLIVPKAGDHKDKIIFWTCFWIMSMIGTVFHDWVWNLFETIFSMLKGYYQSVADRVFSKVIAEVEGLVNAGKAKKD